MKLHIIIQDAETDLKKSLHGFETFIDHLAEKIATAFGLEKEIVAATVTQAINSAPEVSSVPLESSTISGENSTISGS